MLAFLMVLVSQSKAQMYLFSDAVEMCTRAMEMKKVSQFRIEIKSVDISIR